MPRLKLSSSRVVSEVIDGEAIVLDLRVGTYFATDGVGAVAWAAAVDGFSSEEIVASATDSFPDVAEVGRTIADFLKGFVDAGLLTESESDETSDGGRIVWPSSFRAPVLEKHQDLEDMMQLDPIHDTDASGWPMPAPKAPR